MPFDNPILNLKNPPYYLDAHEAVLGVAEKTKGMKINQHLWPFRGVQDEQLFTDEFYYGPEEPKWCFIIVTGTHGIEGIAGSAFLYETIKDIPRLVALMPEPTGVYVVHTLNAFGASFGRRPNKYGVDICRNFLDHPCRHENPVYDELYTAINPTSLDPVSEVWHLQKIARYIRRYGLRKLVQWLAMGQWKHEKGLQFGGKAPTPENLYLHGRIKNIPQSVRVFVVIDFHCGLGFPGVGSILTSYEGKSPLYQSILRWNGGIVLTPEEVRALTTNPGNLGSVDDGLARALRATHPDAKIFAFTYEFGTVGSDELSLRKLAFAERESHWAWNHGRHSRFWAWRARQATRTMWNLLYPRSNSWCEALQRGPLRMLNQTFFGVAASEYEQRTPLIAA